MSKEGVDYCIVCGVDIGDKPNEDCPHVVWSDKWDLEDKIKLS